MSMLTTILVGAGIVGTVYYVGEVLPAKRRSARRKKAQTTTPTPRPQPSPEVIVVDKAADLDSADTLLIGKPVMILMTMRPGTVYAQVLPIFEKLAEQYPDVTFIDVQMGQILEELSNGQLEVKTDVSQVAGAYTPDGFEPQGQCVRLYEGPLGVDAQLSRNGETMNSEVPCVDADIRDMDDVVNKMVMAAEAARNAAQQSGTTMAAMSSPSRQHAAIPLRGGFQ